MSEEKTYNERYTLMKKGLSRTDIKRLGKDFTNYDVAKVTGNTPDSIKNKTQPNQSFPRNLKLAIFLYEYFTETIRILKDRLVKVEAKYAKVKKELKSLKDQINNR